MDRKKLVQLIPATRGWHLRISNSYNVEIACWALTETGEVVALVESADSQGLITGYELFELLGKGGDDHGTVFSPVESQKYFLQWVEKEGPLTSPHDDDWEPVQITGDPRGGVWILWRSPS